MKSEKNGIITLLLVFFFGFWGFHRFYVGKIGTGILMLFSAGGLFIWWIIDIVMVISGKFKDKENQIIVIEKIEEYKKASEAEAAAKAAKEAAEKAKEEKERARKEKRRQKRIASKEKKRKEKLIERKEKLSEKYGEEFALALISKTVMKGMSPEMVYEIIGKHNLKYKKDEEYYFSVPEDEFDFPDKVNRVITFKNGKVEIDKEIDNGICLDMPKDALIASWGEADDKKENVSKDKVKLKFYYGKTETSRGTTKYEYEVNLENDLVVGWKEL